MSELILLGLAIGIALWAFVRGRRIWSIQKSRKESLDAITPSRDDVS